MSQKINNWSERTIIYRQWHEKFIKTYPIFQVNYLIPIETNFIVIQLLKTLTFFIRY